jgi:hypothetical protein
VAAVPAALHPPSTIPSPSSALLFAVVVPVACATHALRRAAGLAIHVGASELAEAEGGLGAEGTGGDAADEHAEARVTKGLSERIGQHTSSG